MQNDTERLDWVLAKLAAQDKVSAKKLGKITRMIVAGVDSRRAVDSVMMHADEVFDRIRHVVCRYCHRRLISDEGWVPVHKEPESSAFCPGSGTWGQD